MPRKKLPQARQRLPLEVIDRALAAWYAKVPIGVMRLRKFPQALATLWIDQKENPSAAGTATGS